LCILSDQEQGDVKKSEKERNEILSIRKRKKGDRASKKKNLERISEIHRDIKASFKTAPIELAQSFKCSFSSLTSSLSPALS
jgi:hypothetical protein